LATVSDSFSCPNCGAAVTFPEGRIADTCSFCETPLVQDAQEEREPVDLVAPFRLTREVASGRLRGRLSGEFWAAEAVRKTADPEELDGVLVPFWCYDATARSEYQGEVGIYWYETQTYTVVVNGRTQVRTRQVRRTEWHSLSGTHVHTYEDHLVSGSQGLPEAESNALEPFDLGAARPFSPELIAGLIAEHPTVSHTEAEKTAGEELTSLENRTITRFLPGDDTRNVHNSTTTHVDDVRLVLLPVWIATFRHNGAVFRMMVNGQTGEVVGKVPKSKTKIGCAVGCGVAMVVGMIGMVLLMGLIGGSMQ
jgi:hypothetical protein